MRSIPALIVAVALQVAGSPALAQRLPFQKSFDAAGVTTLDVSTIRGKINIVSDETGRIQIAPQACSVTISCMGRLNSSAVRKISSIASAPAISRLNAPIRCIGVIPATENMPGGRAIKPGDILTGASGKTVEILNTDAEGRLILGDGIWYAQQLGATHLVDLATLTGACVVALGKTTSGLFGTPDSWVEQVRRASEAVRAMGAT